MTVENIKIICQYEETQSPFEGITDNFYACNLNTSIGYSLANIIEANPPPAGKIFADINLIIINNVEASIFPQGLQRIFPNILGIKIKNSGLRKISQNDFRDFNGLKFLSITDNLIQLLSGGIFSSNPQLEFIEIKRNMIIFVDEKVFDGLENLKILRFDFQCFNEVNAENIEKVQSLVENLKSSSCVETQFLLAMYENYIENEIAEKKNASDENLELKNCKNEKILLEDRIHELEFLISPEATCNFREDPSEGYSCIANKILINSPENRQILWNGTHIGIKSNSDVKTLLIKFQFTYFLPSEIAKSFDEIENLIVESSKLQKLSKNDFLGLENLRKISLTNNEISTVESETFDRLKKLKILNLSRNSISSLGSKIFAKLEGLLSLDLSENLLTELRADVLASTNNIKEFFGGNNNLIKIDIYFIWRLKNCVTIDLSGNQKCNLKFNVVDRKFEEFFSVVLGQC